MLTTREAARLLAAAGDAHRPAPLATLTHALGFGAPLSLHPRDIARLDITDAPRAAAVAAGPGTLRVFVVEWDEGPPLRDRIVAIARGVARRAPGQHWLVVARHAARRELCLAAPDGSPRETLPVLAMECTALRESDAETFAALVAVTTGGGGAAARGDAGADPSATLIHLQWRETLGREALTRRFYRDLERAVDALARTATGRARADDRRLVALLTTSRLLFLAFLETKGWLDRDRAFLRHHMERVAARGSLHAGLLEPLSFGTLNTPVARRARAALAFGRVPFLNGGLFQRAPVETRCRTLRLQDDAIATVIGELLPRYRLTARERSDALSDAAVDPEMLGRAFEQLMGGGTRRVHGAFYTPQPLIARITGGALAALGAASGDLARLRLLDPACGSGAFLVHALETLAALRIARGDARPVSTVRREVLTRSIFGVDLDPTAVWLCQLRLWLSVVVEDERDDPMRFPPLPNLDRNVREGDALAGLGFADARTPDGSALAVMRLRYARASGARKRTLARALDAAERARALRAADQLVARLSAERRELLQAARSPDLFASRRVIDARARRALLELRGTLREARAAVRRLRDGGALPFAFSTHFPEVADAGGFDLVIGNPPWVRPHALPAETRDRLRAQFVTGRHAAWEAGAEAAGAGRGFASQADLAAIFTERALQLVRDGGCVALLLPSKLWCALAGGGVRDLLTKRATLLALDDWAGWSAGFDAVVYPSALLARRGAPAGDAALTLTLHRGSGARAWRLPSRTLALDATPGAPWLLLPPVVRAAFDAIERAGVPLAASPFGRPILGVKSGCNEAFVVTRLPHAADATSVRSGDTAGEVESALLRPLVRGEHVRAWHLADEAAGSAIVWTHDRRGTALRTLPPHAQRWLVRWRRRLEARTDGRTGPWWALFRTDAARDDRPRVVWADIGRAPRALVLRAGDRAVPLNSCYVLRAPSEEDAHALAGLINSPLTSAWLNAVAEPARGGYRRYLGWTCARLPIPHDWLRARALLAPLGRAGAAGDAPSAAELTRAALSAYGLAPDAVVALLEWEQA